MEDKSGETRRIQTTPGRRPEWKDGILLARDGVSVKVSWIDRGRPRFSIMIGGNPKEDGVPSRFIRVDCAGQGCISVVSNAAVLESLMLEAEEWIREKAQAAEDAWIERKAAKEARDLARNPVKRRK